MGIAIRSRGRGHHPRRGAAATELALLLPMMVFVTLATTDFARIFYYTAILNDCARNGALYASDPSTRLQSPYYNTTLSTAVTSAVQADATNLSPLPTADAPTYSSTVNGTYSSTIVSNGYVQVTARWAFNTIITYPGIPSTMNLSQSVRMRMIQ